MKDTKSTPFRRALSGLLCAAVCLSFLPTMARAEENTGAPTVTVTQEVTTDQVTGNVTTTTTTITEGEGLLKTEEETLITDAEGNVIVESGYEAGSETKTEEKDGENLTVEFEGLEPGQEVTATEETLEPTVSGDIKTGEDDPEYDQTTVSETSRELTGTLTGTEVTLGDGDVEYSGDITIGVESLEPIWPERGADQNLNVHDNSWSNFDPDGDPPEGYDYYYSAYTGDSTYGVKVLDKDGKVLQYCDVVQFELINGVTQEKHTAYCADLNTGTENGWWYTMENVEDANYVSAEDAAHIKTIAANGYWGTAEGTGSLTQMKADLKAALAENPDALGGLTAEDIEGLTAGEAQTATQMAIWMYGNHFKDMEVTFTASNCNDSGDGSGDVSPSEEDLAAWNRINQISAYLSKLSAEGTDSQILSPDKFISDLGLTVGGKVEGHENNADADSTNDAYNVDLTFALEVIVTEDDDLIVKVLDAGGTVLRTVRLAGDDSETGYGTILPDESGKYTIGGLTLIEGEAAFNITLEGAQYLEQGVYIYSSEVRDCESSQTFVGMAEGYQTVDLSMEVEFRFQVEEGTVTTQRIWRDEWYKELAEEETTAPTTEETTEATTETTEETTGTTDGNGTDVPRTGDESGIVQWMLMMLFCAMALIAAVFGLIRRA